MVSKIEAAERLAKMVERYNHEHGVLGLQDVVDACTTYRSASVPSDEDLGRVAYTTTGLTAQYEWNDLTDVQRRKWSEAAAAVREWVQRDGLDDAEREVIVDAMQAYLVGDPKCEPARSILRKLGHEPEPVWEWDEANAMWTLGGKVDSQIFPCASVMLSSAGLRARVYLSEMNATSVTVDGFKEACEWCEQKIREARQ